MTALAFFAGLFVGWLSLAVGAGLVLGAAIRWADRQALTVPTICDPDTGAVWTETKRLGEVWL